MRPSVAILAATVILAGCGTDEGAQAHRSPRFVAPSPVLARGVYVVRRDRRDPADPIVAVQTRHHEVALTFDDGPDPRWTPAVLRSLQRAGAHASFFTIGRRLRAHAVLARRAARLGDEVENHTWSHPILLKLTPAAVGREVTLGRRQILRAGLPRPAFFRPPHGAFDATVTRAATAAGERTIGWDTPLDRELDGRSIPAAVAATAAQVHPGSIILAHDGGGRIRARTVRAIPLLLAALRARGLRVVTVSTLLRGCRPACPR